MIALKLNAILKHFIIILMHVLLMCYTIGRQPFGPHGPPVVRRPPVGDHCSKGFLTTPHLLFSNRIFYHSSLWQV